MDRITDKCVAIEVVQSASQMDYIKLDGNQKSKRCVVKFIIKFRTQTGAVDFVTLNAFEVVALGGNFPSGKWVDTITAYMAEQLKDSNLGDVPEKEKVKKYLTRWHQHLNAQNIDTFTVTEESLREELKRGSKKESEDSKKSSTKKADPKKAEPKKAEEPQAKQTKGKSEEVAEKPQTQSKTKTTPAPAPTPTPTPVPPTHQDEDLFVKGPTTINTENVKGIVSRKMDDANYQKYVDKINKAMESVLAGGHKPNNMEFIGATTKRDIALLHYVDIEKSIRYLFTVQSLLLAYADGIIVEGDKFWINPITEGPKWGFTVALCKDSIFEPLNGTVALCLSDPQSVKTESDEDANSLVDVKIVVNDYFTLMSFYLTTTKQVTESLFHAHLVNCMKGTKLERLPQISLWHLANYADKEVSRLIQNFNIKHIKKVTETRDMLSGIDNTLKHVQEKKTQENGHKDTQKEAPPKVPQQQTPPKKRKSDEIAEAPVVPNKGKVDEDVCAVEESIAKAAKRAPEHSSKTPFTLEDPGADSENVSMPDILKLKASVQSEIKREGGLVRAYAEMLKTKLVDRFKLDIKDVDMMDIDKASKYIDEIANDCVKKYTQMLKSKLVDKFKLGAKDITRVDMMNIDQVGEYIDDIANNYEKTFEVLKVSRNELKTKLQESEGMLKDKTLIEARQSKEIEKLTKDIKAINKENMNWEASNRDLEEQIVAIDAEKKLSDNKYSKAMGDLSNMQIIINDLEGKLKGASTSGVSQEKYDALATEYQTACAQGSTYLAERNHFEQELQKLQVQVKVLEDMSDTGPKVNKTLLAENLANLNKVVLGLKAAYEAVDEISDQLNTQLFSSESQITDV
jgi:hypothetical protein